jgi:hypothetical protein
MRKSGMVALVVMGGVALTACAKKKKDELPQLFCQAQFVYVQTYEGELGPAVAEDYPHDYDEAQALEQRLQDWRRYTLTMNRNEADLVFVVRAGRVANGVNNNPYPMPVPNVPGSDPQAQVPITGNPGRVGVGGPAGQGGPGMGGPGAGGPGGGGPGTGPGADGQVGPGMGPGMGRGMGGDVGPPNDWLAVYMKPGDQSEETLHAPIWEHSERDGLQGPMPLFQKIKDAVESQCSTGRAGGPPSTF